ncbi:ER-derived vesicles protein erv46 [Cryptotrichosporon argae]
MGRNGFFGSFQGFDAFGKTMDDVKIRTRTGALLTMISASIILTSIMLEFVDYRRVHLEPSIEVDRSRGEKLVIELDVTFPRVPCYLLSLDVMDISGEHQTDLSHDVEKSRISKDGKLIETRRTGLLKGEAARAAQNRDPGYCGSCYGGTPPESGCCNSCDEVRESYVRKGWSFSDPNGIEQCVEEHWVERTKEQNTEGCRMRGRVKVNKVIGNLHFSPGRTFQNNLVNLAELVPYLKDSNHHDFGHVINDLRFAADVPPALEKRQAPKELAMRDKLGIKDPLRGVQAHTEEYFVKVVSTEFVTLAGEQIPSHQYSVTQYERDLRKGNAPGKDAHGHMTSHGMMGVPGVFINYEISPMKIIHTETRQSFAHFLTSSCAIIGGVLTVASLVDAFIFSSKKRLAGTAELDGFGARAGKMM